MTTVDTAFVAPPDYMDAPVPEPARFGLFSVARMLPDAGLRWQPGVEWEPLSGTPADLASSSCLPAPYSDDAAGHPLVARAGGDREEALPFVVVGSYVCPTFSRDLEEAENRARQHLSLWEERAVEEAIAAGGFDNAPTFQGATDLTPAGGTAEAAHGVGLLEAELARGYAGLGTIHSPRVASAVLVDRAGVRRQGQRMETAVGTLVAFGGGYDIANVGPDGSIPAEGETWLYATSRPWVRRGEVFVTPDGLFRPDTANNDVTIFAQRVYLVGWERVTAAVRVSLTA